MSKEKQIEEKVCKKCLHYEMCLENFRRAKEEGLWELTTEEEYFSYANECDFFIAGYRKRSEVVKCKDCEHLYQIRNVRMCRHWNYHSTKDDAYCSFAKRKGGGK